MLDLLDRILDRLEEWIIGVLIAAATCITFVAVVHRYGASNSVVLADWANAHGLTWLGDAADWVYLSLAAINLSWAQELATYMFVWMAKFGAAYGVRTGIHVGVDVVVNLLSPTPRRYVVLFSLFCGALFTAVVGTMGAKFVIELAQTDQVSADLELPRWIVFSCVPLGSYLMCFRFLQVAWAYWRTGELPHHDPGHVEGVIESPAVAKEMAR